MVGLIGALWGVITGAQAQTDQPGLPAIASIVRTTPSTQIMRAGSVVFTVTFSEAVTNVGVSSFAIVPVNGGNTVATIASVTGGPSIYQVTVNLTGGAGDFRLDVGPTVSVFASGFRNSSALAFDQAGNLYVGDDDDQKVKKVTSGGVVSTFASGFGAPYGIAVSSAGDIYVTNNSEVKKITSGGVVSTFATGFNVACGLAFDSTGNLYVGNYSSNKISKVTPGGAVSTFATNINAPLALAFDSAGNLYAACRDAGMIAKITPGGVVSTFATGFNGPEGLQFDASGDLFVADRWANRVARVKPDGTVSTYAANMPASYGLAFDAAGAIYVTSYYNDNKVRKLTLPVINDLGGNPVPGLPYTSGETYTYDPNDAPTDIQLSNAVLDEPVVAGATVGALSSTDPDPADTHIYSLVSGAGSTNNSSFVINAGVLQVGASPLASGYYSVRIQSDDGQGGTYQKAFSVSVGIPRILSITRKTPSTQNIGAGSVVFTVTFSEAVTGVTADWFALTPLNGASVAGSVASVTGGPSVYDVAVNITSGAGDFRLNAIVAPPVATTFVTGFGSPSALAMDASGNLFVTDLYDGTVSKVTSGGTVSTFASGFNGPSGLAFDSQGNLYVANSWSGEVSQVTSGGGVSTFASGFDIPYGLAFDSQDNLYMADNDDNAVRQVTSGGSVSTFATGFNGPTALAFNAAGDLYVANQWNNSVSKVTSGGGVTFFSDGFAGAEGLAVDGAGNLYVANNWNNTVTKVTSQGSRSTLVGGIDQPSALVYDGVSNLYVASQGDGSIIKLALPVSIKDLTGNEIVGMPFTSGQSYTLGLNSSPTDITLSNNSVNQSAGANATIGSLTTTDADSGDTHVYTLVTGSGGTDNASFNLSGAALRANNATVLASGSYSVRVRTDDGISVPYEKVFAITVVDDIAPVAPSSFAAYSSNGTVALSWTNPVSDFASCTIRRSTSSYPATVSSGTSVASGLTGTSYNNTGLADGTYYYAIFARDAAGNISVAATAIATVDTTAPSVPSGFNAIVSNNTIALSWTNPASDFASCTIRRSTSGYPATISSGVLVASGLTGTSYNNTGLADGTYYYAIFALDTAGNVSIAATASAAVDTTPPAVTDAKISIAGATGMGGVFKRGDTVVATWNNTAGGDNNTESLSAVTVDFSQFGGGTAIAAINSGGIWTATYTIAPGTIDDINRNVSVTVTDSVGNPTTVADTTNASVDNQAPSVMAANISVAGGTGTSGAFRVGDVVTARWNNTGTGDNNPDALSLVTFNFTQWGGSAAVVANNSSGTWSATYTIVPGFGAAGSRDVSITVADDAGNTTTVSGNAGATIENTAPVNHVPAAQSLAQYGVLVFSGANNNLIGISDADAGNGNVQVTLTATHGTLTLSGTSGLSFSSGSGSSNSTMTFTGTIASVNGALNGLNYAPAGGFFGDATLQIVTDDLGNAGSGGAKTDTDTINLSITEVAAAGPVFTTQPLSRVVFVGAPVTLAGVVTGAPPPTYQWWKNGTAVPGATAAVLNLPNAQLSDAGSYTLTATNSGGVATSHFVRLVVLLPQANAAVYDQTAAPNGVTGGGNVDLDYSVKNVGTRDWAGNHYLSVRDVNGNFVGFASLNGVTPGESKKIHLSFAAPLVPGTYTYTVQGLEDGVEFFVTQTTFTLRVLAQQPNSIAYNSTNFPVSVAPGSNVVFSYNVTNTGTKNWSASHYLSLRNVGNNFLGFSSLAGVAPGQSRTVNLSLTAPTVPGRYAYSLQALEDGVEFFPTQVDLILTVLAPRPNAIVYTLTRSQDNVAPGATISLRYTLNNSGTAAWGAAHYASLRDGNGAFLAFVPLGGVAPGGDIQANFSTVAPTVPGTYAYYVQALEDGVEFFDAQDSVTITVVATPVANAATYNTTTFPVAAPRGSVVSFGENVTNRGTKTWGAGHSLSLRDAENVFLGFKSLAGVAPGASQTVNFSFVAPSQAGVYTYHVQGLESGVEFFNMSDTLVLIVP